MIEGVTLLGVETLVTPSFGLFSAIWIGVVIVFFIVSMVFDIDATIAGILVIGFSLLIVSVTTTLLDAKEETCYLVTLSEDVNAKEFLSTYDIIEVNGDLYTVTIKESECNE